MSYDFSNIKSPKMLVEAIKLIGTKEVIGSISNPVIMEWAEECGIAYNDDSVPWCGLFMALIAKRSDKKIPRYPLRAFSWANFGEPCEPHLGCVLVFTRKGGGHVGAYVGEDAECYHVLGGNQSDSVCVTRIKKERLHASRCQYKIRPDNLGRVLLSKTGEISTNEQ